MNILSRSVLALSCALPGMVQAQQAPTFAEMDVDRDGRLSRKELDKHHAARGKGAS